MKVLIIEDEAHTSDLLKELIEKEAGFQVVDQLESVIEAVAYLSRSQEELDLLFLDIQLADGMSFEIFRHVDVEVPVVFCTAFDEYALEAIRNNGIDYILKPFKEEEIQRTLQKYRNMVASLQKKTMPPLDFSSSQPKPYQQRFLTQFRERTLIKSVEEIAMFGVENEIVYLYSFKGEKLSLAKKLEYIESVCDPQQFFRINRQMLINRSAIQSFEPYFNRKIVLQLTIQLEEKPVVSRLKVSEFKEWLVR